jgi:hypothetical protein
MFSEVGSFVLLRQVQFEGGLLVFQLSCYGVSFGFEVENRDLDSRPRTSLPRRHALPGERW